MKISHIIALSSLIALSSVMAWTPTDEKNANFLAGEGVIVDYTSSPKSYRLDDRILRQEIVAIALKMK